MIQLTDHGMYLVNGVPQETAATAQEEARRRTMAWQILQAHNVSPDPMQLRIRFDAMVSHDITYVGIIQQARASGMKEFPIPYALTNCHNSLCAVGGTINEDDHMFGLSAAKKYGGIYVPANPVSYTHLHHGHKPVLQQETVGQHAQVRSIAQGLSLIHI